MANKYLDQEGLMYFWGKLKDYFVAKETGKGLSSNDFTAAEKTKLNGIETEANKTIVVDALTSTSSSSALSANQGKELKSQIDAINSDMEALGNGDMLKSVYDVDGDGVVDKAANATNFNGQPASFYAKATDIPTVTNDLTDALKQNYNTAYSHSQAAHAPTNAEKNAIVSVKKNGTALTIDNARSVDITVPTKVSELTNDRNYLTAHQDISGLAPKSTTLAGYGITNAYTKNEVDSAISSAVANSGHLKREIVESLPAVSAADEHTIYMILEESESGDNKYVEWMLVNGAFEKTGDTDIDLSGYWQKADLVALTNAEIDAILAA